MAQTIGFVYYYNFGAISGVTASDAPTTFALLLEDDFFLLLEDDISHLLLES